ncbi:S9 family peptidase [Bradyrhizobium sp. CCBAU 53421]|uniref:S9 family peptidase n=1 Tax=Bradyrhizobium sp. CCBAU 53421 TaxID=1325120 RepID=UPI00188B1B38|nr:S9 family peptidase [Bradyrhizobium sp. CCBAU 53421]QOZ33150.1 S9 family peptidase [Bradyrhizobium sp. CCBAU 53421]
MPAPIDRRLLLRRATVLGASLPFVGLIGPVRAEPPALIARRVFFDNPDYINVRLSPDGTQLSWVAPLDGVNNLWVAPLSDLRAARPVTRVTDRNISAEYRWAHTNRHVVFFRERDGDENWRAASVDITDGKIVPLTPETGVRAFLQESDRKFPEEMLLRHNQRDKRYFDMYRVNVVTGASELVYENHDYTGLITDSTFQLRLASRLIADGSAEVFERHPDGSWAPFMTVPIAETDTTHLLDFSADGKMLYLIDSRGRDKAALFAVDMATRQTTLLAADDDADIVRAIFDQDRRPLAALAITDRMRWHAVDQSVANDLADLGRYGAGDINFVSNSDDLRLGTVHFERDTESGEFALLDRRTREVRKLFTQRSALDGLALRTLQPVVIPSRDGLRLNGYLTRPVEAAAGVVPLVLVIHGGPYYRDTWGFSPVHQWLANRGYAVLAVNYRGSTGFGKAFITAADHEWGGKMHDDLIDAVDWAIAQAIADPKRIGFFGGSYGGYSALVAATRTPDVFACIVDLFGISNLVTFMATIPPYWGPWISVWKNRLGDPGTEAGRAFLVERSPLTHIDRAVKPILIAQGMRDVRVVAAESEQMVNALKQHGVPVTYITFADEGHGFVRPENRLAFYGVTEAFLAKHLGGRCQPVGNDFAGSSLKVETGAELVPGLHG